MTAEQYLPPGGRGTAKRWMRNGDTLPFVMQSIQTVQPFPMYLFNEMHTDSEHIAVPHPPQCAHWGTFPPGEGIALHHPYKHQFTRQLGKTDMRIIQILIPAFFTEPPVTGSCEDEALLIRPFFHTPDPLPNSIPACAV